MLSSILDTAEKRIGLTEEGSEEINCNVAKRKKEKMCKRGYKTGKVN